MKQIISLSIVSVAFDTAKMRSMNGPKCETFYMKMSSACSLAFMQIKLIFIETEAQGNSEMAYLVISRYRFAEDKEMYQEL